MKKAKKFKIGDLVEIISVPENWKYYSKDFKCILVGRDRDKDWWAEFIGQGNASVYTSSVGRTEWCIGNNVSNTATYGTFRLVGEDK